MSATSGHDSQSLEGEETPLNRCEDSITGEDTPSEWCNQPGTSGMRDELPLSQSSASQPSTGPSSASCSQEKKRRPNEDEFGGKETEGQATQMTVCATGSKTRWPECLVQDMCSQGLSSPLKKTRLDTATDSEKFMQPSDFLVDMFVAYNRLKDQHWRTKYVIMQALFNQHPEGKDIQKMIATWVRRSDRDVPKGSQLNVTDYQKPDVFMAQNNTSLSYKRFPAFFNPETVQAALYVSCEFKKQDDTTIIITMAASQLMSGLSSRAEQVLKLTALLKDVHINLHNTYEAGTQPDEYILNQDVFSGFLTLLLTHVKKFIVWNEEKPLKTVFRRFNLKQIAINQIKDKVTSILQSHGVTKRPEGSYDDLSGAYLCVGGVRDWHIDPDSVMRSKMVAFVHDKLRETLKSIEPLPH